VSLYAQKLLEDRGHHVTTIDAKEKNLPMLDRMYKEYEPGRAPQVMQELADIYRQSDCFVIVCGEYNHGLQAGLKNLLDHYLEEYFYRPSAIISYSPSPVGGLRAAVHLRAVLSELGMASIPSILSIGKVKDALNEKGERIDGKDPQISKKFLDELEWYAFALAEARSRGVPESKD